MIVWRGWGVLALVIAAAPLLLVGLMVDTIAGAGSFERIYGWAAPPIMLLAAGAIWVVGRRLNGGRRVLTHERTGERVELRPDHSLFFLKMEYWAAPLAIGAVVVFVAGLVS